MIIFDINIILCHNKYVIEKQVIKKYILNNVLNQLFLNYSVCVINYFFIKIIYINNIVNYEKINNNW